MKKATFFIIIFLVVGIACVFSQSFTLERGPYSVPYGQDGKRIEGVLEISFNNRAVFYTNGEAIQGTYSISGNKLTVRFEEGWSWSATITSSRSLLDSDGVTWWLNGQRR